MVVMGGGLGFLSLLRPVLLYRECSRVLCTAGKPVVSVAVSGCRGLPPQISPPCSLPFARNQCYGSILQDSLGSSLPAAVLTVLHRHADECWSITIVHSTTITRDGGLDTLMFCGWCRVDVTVAPDLNAAFPPNPSPRPWYVLNLWPRPWDDDFTCQCYYSCSDERMKDEGREAYVSEIAGRFVIPVTPTYKRTVGIVHDSSRTGKTLYVEPTQVRSINQQRWPRCMARCLVACHVAYMKYYTYCVRMPKNPISDKRQSW